MKLRRFHGAHIGSVQLIEQRRKFAEITPGSATWAISMPPLMTLTSPLCAPRKYKVFWALIFAGPDGRRG